MTLLTHHTPVVRSSTHVFTGQQGQTIETAIDWPANTPRGFALCLHPHPLYQGTNRNKVVTTLAKACLNEGFIAVRPNFRGVGASEGQFDNARGETADMLALLPQLHTLLQAQSPTLPPKAPWLLGGFSFGASVAAQLYAELADQGAPLPAKVLLLGSGVWRFAYRDIALPSHTFVVHGQADDVIPIEEVIPWLQTQGLPITLIPGATHFFHGHLILLRQLLQDQIRLLNFSALSV